MNDDLDETLGGLEVGIQDTGGLQDQGAVEHPLGIVVKVDVKDRKSNRTTVELEVTIAPRKAASKAMAAMRGRTGGVTAQACVREGRFRVLGEAEAQDWIGRPIILTTR